MLYFKIYEKLMLIMRKINKQKQDQDLIAFLEKVIG